MGNTEENENLGVQHPTDECKPASFNFFLKKSPKSSHIFFPIYKLGLFTIGTNADFANLLSFNHQTIFYIFVHVCYIVGIVCKLNIENIKFRYAAHIFVFPSSINKSQFVHISISSTVYGLFTYLRVCSHVSCSDFYVESIFKCCFLPANCLYSKWWLMYYFTCT